jgi:hypothetical protein
MAKTTTLKHEVRERIDQLPEDCTVEDIHYRLYLLEKLRRGEASLKKGGVAHGDVRKRAAGWRKK